MGGKESPESCCTAPRLCHLVKWPHFQGYGFNLHSEKGRDGQFVGQIDAHSPAEACGLCEGDRIYEVNGVHISNENHKQVVERIKSDPLSVSLLVLSPSGVQFYMNRAVEVTGDMDDVVHLQTPPADQQDVADSSDPTVCAPVDDIGSAQDTQPASATPQPPGKAEQSDSGSGVNISDKPVAAAMEAQDIHDSSGVEMNGVDETKSAGSADLQQDSSSSVSHDVVATEGDQERRLEESVAVDAESEQTSSDQAVTQCQTDLQENTVVEDDEQGSKPPGAPDTEIEPAQDFPPPPDLSDIIPPPPVDDAGDEQDGVIAPPPPPENEQILPSPAVAPSSAQPSGESPQPDAPAEKSSDVVEHPENASTQIAVDVADDKISHTDDDRCDSGQNSPLIEHAKNYDSQHPSASPAPSLDSAGSDSTKSSTPSGGGTEDKFGLKLNMSAAEMKLYLKSKKRPDPRNNNLTFKQRHNIVSNM